MKKSETLERTRNAKVKFLEKYFEYHKDKELIIRQLSDEMESHSTCDSFKKHVIALHGVTPCGKNTVLFWMERGYSADESDELVKPYKVKRDASRSPMNIDYWKNKGYTEEESMYMIKSQRKTNVEYWLSRGFDVVAANAAMSEFQKQQACSYAALRKARPDKYRLSNSLTVDYWIDKGYDTDAAKQMLAERQSTFSKQKCIDELGIVSGLEKFKERQDRWQKTLSKTYNGVTGKSVPMTKKITSYDKKRLIDSISFKNRHEIYDIITSCEDIESVISRYVDIIRTDDEITFMKAMRPIVNNTFFKIYYGVTREYIYSLIIPKLTFVKTRYGNIRWFNGHICRSDVEYQIAKFLVDSNIRYEYERYYNKDIFKLRCDFYLSDYEYYIEYNGMRNKNYDKKKTLLSNNSINNVHYSDNLTDIKEFIQNLT